MQSGNGAGQKSKQGALKGLGIVKGIVCFGCVFKPCAERSESEPDVEQQETRKNTNKLKVKGPQKRQLRGTGVSTDFARDFKGQTF